MGPIPTIALANSLADDNGYRLPFPDVSIPSNPPTNEQMGFELGIGAAGNPDYQADSLKPILEGYEARLELGNRNRRCELLRIHRTALFIY